MLHSIRSVLVLGAVLAFASGCQVISASFTSPSDWSRGSSESSRGSSEGSSTASGSGSSSPSGSSSSSTYRDDVRVFARTFAERDEAPDSFVRDLGRVAERHGVTHWEGRADTFFAIGAGLREAGMPEDQVDVFLRSVGLPGDQARAHALDGYRSAG